MALLSPTAAAKAWKIGKSTIYKAMNSGELSFTLDSKGKRVIDHSEMVRVFGEQKKDQYTNKNDSGTNERITDLKESLERQERQQGDYIETLKAQIDSQQKQLEAMTDSIDRFTRLLEHQQPAPKSEVVEPVLVQEPTTTESEMVKNQPVKRRRSFLGRILAAAIDD